MIHCLAMIVRNLSASWKNFPVALKRLCAAVCVFFVCVAVFAQEVSSQEALAPPRRLVPIETFPDSPQPYSDPDVDFELRSSVRPVKPGDPVPLPELIVDSLPVGAEVYINDRYTGMTPFTLRNINPGGYRLTLRKARYKAASVFIALEPGKTFRLYARLSGSSGVLKLLVEPPDAGVYADGQRLLSSEAELPVGSRDILIRRFGYVDYRTSVSIQEGQTASLEAVLEPAVFRAEDFSLSRNRLNPANPGLAGTTEFSFTVTGPGRARLIILDPEGREVFAREFPPFTDWNQRFLWDGRDFSGGELPGGMYRARILCVAEVAEMAGNEAEEIISFEADIEIDPELVIRYTSTWHGLSGLMFAPLAPVLPPLDFQVNSSFMALAAAPDDPDHGNLSFFQAGGVVGIVRNLELVSTLSLGARSGEGGWQDISGSLGLKYLFSRMEDFLFLTLTARGMVAADPSYEAFSQFPGFATGPAATVRLGAFGLTASPEFQVSPYAAGREVSTHDVSAHVWTNLRFGIFYEAGFLTAGLSCALPVALFPEKPGVHSPVLSGLELHALIPDSFLNISGFAAWEHSPRAGESDYLFLGAGIGIVY
ncbi:MAG: PEGA domain-containing protein [Spirochaetales bacterium]|nr:PEGA domain-containing protein [Spirochaetales bacterium]